jgi:hypothetical protein
LAKGNRRRAGRMAEQSYEPILPAKVGNRRVPIRGGHGTHWREGANKRTYQSPHSRAMADVGEIQ